jgi:hypothetical protein
VERVPAALIVTAWLNATVPAITKTATTPKQRYKATMKTMRTEGKTKERGGQLIKAQSEIDVTNQLRLERYEDSVQGIVGHCLDYIHANKLEGVPVKTVYDFFKAGLTLKFSKEHGLVCISQSGMAALDGYAFKLVQEVNILDDTTYIYSVAAI